MSIRAFAEIEVQWQGYDKIQLYTNLLMGTNVVLYAGCRRRRTYVEKLKK